MKCRLFISIGFGLWTLSSVTSVLASYDSGPGYGISHSSYPAAPLAHGHSQGWNSGHAAGSYYHYHVPLVGQQQQHYQPQPQQSQDHHLYILLPLLLLAGLPLLLLPLLPLLLLPLGLSLLALLLPLLMGGMMMMMMMMGGMMPMMMRNPTSTYSHNGEARDFGFGFGHLVLHDLSQLLTRYARSLDLDSCPERISCEAGSFIFPDNATESVTARTLMNFLVEQATPKGKARRILRSYKQAFWTGSKTGSCSQFTCQPTFRLFTSNSQSPFSSSSADSNNVNFNITSAKSNFPYADYYNLYGGGDHQKQNSTNLNYHNYYKNPSSAPLNGHGSNHFPAYVNHPSNTQSGSVNANNVFASYGSAYNSKKPIDQPVNAWKNVHGQPYETSNGEAYSDNEIRSAKT